MTLVEAHHDLRATSRFPFLPREHVFAATAHHSIVVDTMPPVIRVRSAKFVRGIEDILLDDEEHR